MKKLIFFILGLVCTGMIWGHAQSPPEIRPLHIGDTVPDILFQQVMNYPDTTARLSDFTKNKKLLILDFWSTGCSSCIELFPKMQSLADNYKKDLQIILLNSQTQIWHDNEKTIDGLLKKMDKRIQHPIKLPIVLNNKLLDKYFPYQTLPQEVWINSKDRVIAITKSAEVTRGNIEKILKGIKIAMPVKQDVIFNLENQSLSKLSYDNDEVLNKVLFSSVITKGYIDGLGCRLGVRHATPPYRRLYIGWYMTNSPLLLIYKSVYKKMESYPENRILIKTKDSSLFTKTNLNDTSMYSKVYSYDITAPPSTLEMIHQYVRDDLSKMFGTKVIYGKRRMNCYVIKSGRKISKSHSTDGTRQYVMSKIDSRKYVRNFPIDELVHILNKKYLKIPLIDKTNLKANVDIDFPKDLSQHNIVYALRRAGFKVEKKKSPINVAIITDK